jgi:hypothetical protein
VSRRTLGACAGVLVAVGVASLPLRDHPGEARDTRASWPTAAIAASARDDALRRARTRLGGEDPHALTAPRRDATGLLTRESVNCDFVPRIPGGTSSKFECALADGEIVRVKYGNEPEIHAEVAATRLLASLGYATDDMYIVPRLRCHGCPANPFVTMKVLDLIGHEPHSTDEFTDFEWVAVERRFEGAPIEDDERKGWAWWELKDVKAPADDLDALRLLAVFLAHWDNKADNQRLVCMDTDGHDPDRRCADPLLMIQDLGATFGPAKVNLSQWRTMPIWIDRATCTVSMKAMPYRGSTFVDARLTEAARLRVGSELAVFTDTDLRGWFAAARFPQFYAATDDDKDLAAWVAAYRLRVDQILSGGPCPQ